MFYFHQLATAAAIHNNEGFLELYHRFFSLGGVRTAVKLGASHEAGRASVALQQVTSNSTRAEKKLAPNDVAESTPQAACVRVNWRRRRRAAPTAGRDRVGARRAARPLHHGAAAPRGAGRQRRGRHPAGANRAATPSSPAIAACGRGS